MHKYVWEIEINKGAARWIVERLWVQIPAPYTGWKLRLTKVVEGTTQMHKEISDWAGALV